MDTTLPEAGLPRVHIVTAHRLAGGALAAYLAGEIPVVPTIGALDELRGAAVGIVDAVHDSSLASPRALREAVSNSGRVVMLHDRARSGGSVLVTAYYAQVFSVHDVREATHLLLDRVRVALEGQERVPDWMGAQWSRALREDKAGLSPREREVIEALYAADDVGIAEVAEHLGLSVNTVRVHLANVRKKLSGRTVGNRDSLRTALVERGWLDD